MNTKAHIEARLARMRVVMATSKSAQALIDLFMTALARHLQEHGTLTIPLQIGQASTHCHTCPFALKSETPAPNIVSFSA